MIKKKPTKAALEWLDEVADLARVLAKMSGVPLRAWLQAQHEDAPAALLDMIVERARPARRAGSASLSRRRTQKP